MRRDCGHVVSLCIAVCFCSVVALFCSCAKNQTAHEHEFVENTIVEASCINEGVVERKCACGYTEIETTNKLPHDYVVERLVEATCERDGYSVTACRRCNKTVYEIKQKLPHDLVTGEVAADCFTRGYKLSECKNCGFSSLEYMTEAPLKHNFVLNGKIRVACEKPYEAIYKCLACGTTENRKTSEIASHVFETTDFRDATCTSDGIIRRKCVYCDDSSTETIKATGHKTALIRIAPTCMSEGKLLYRCVNAGCDYSENEQGIAKIAHEYYCEKLLRNVYSYDGIALFLDSDCKNQLSGAMCYEIESGMHFKCKNCDLVKESVSHDTETVDTATCISEGEKITRCSRCGEKFSSVKSAAKGHVHDENIFICSENEELSDEYLAKTGKSERICYKCTACGMYVKSGAHTPDVEDSEVTCVRAQKCSVCGQILQTKDHVAPALTCVSIKSDEFYYCAVCGEYAMGKLSPHAYEYKSTIDATCIDNRKEVYECVCKATKTEEIENTALGHRAPARDMYVCRISEEATREYFNLTGKDEPIAFKCINCDQYVKVSGHEYNCMPEEVDCMQDRHCLVCGFVDIERPDHIAPEFTCVDTANDGMYHCVACGIALGVLTPHVYNHEAMRVPATCKENIKLKLTCNCGAVDPDNEFYEEPDTKLGHKLPDFKIDNTYDCEKGHVLKFEVTRCLNDGCTLDFTDLVDENGRIYCLTLENYLSDNGFADDYIYDKNALHAGDKKVRTVASCCASTNYLFVPKQHAFGTEPFATSDYTDEAGITYKYIPSTCVTSGSALYVCSACYTLYYNRNMPLNPLKHEGENLYGGGKYCEKCVPEDYDREFVWELNVLRSDGTPALVHGLPSSDVYSAEFLKGKLVEVNEGGVICYKFTDEYIVTLVGMQYYKDADSAKNENAKGLFDWGSFRLYKNQRNVLTVYLSGDNT